jgi:hypothetical protein
MSALIADYAEGKHMRTGEDGQHEGSITCRVCRHRSYVLLNGLRTPRRICSGN